MERQVADKFLIDDKKPVKPKEKRKVFKVHEQISKVEQMIFKEAKQIERKREQAEELFKSLHPTMDDSKTVALTRKAPLNFMMELMDSNSMCKPERLNDWEKSNFEKTFKSLDDFGNLIHLTSARTKTIKRESLSKLFTMMERDDTFLGKVPSISSTEFDAIVSKRLKDKKELSYLTFRLLLDDFAWKPLKKADAVARSDALYESGKVMLRHGKDADALNEAIKAMSLTKYAV